MPIHGTPNIQQLIKMAAQGCRYQDVQTQFTPEAEEAAGNWIVRHLLAGDRGHWGPFEHGSITFRAEGFSHALMQQARTHRVGVSFDVASFRAISGPLLDAAQSGYLGSVFYLPSEVCSVEAVRCLKDCLHAYSAQVESGVKPEDARFLLPGYALRQNFTVTFNLQSLLHFLDLRSKADAQAEIREFSKQAAIALSLWAPEVWLWYAENRYKKARLAP